MPARRRRLLKLGGIALAGLAGCSAPADGDATTAADATATPTATPAGTPASTGGTPGGNVLGGPNDLRAGATVRARVLDGDQGAGRYVFSPAVVWVEEGASITWTIEDAAHSVTAYHADNGGRATRIPAGAEPFDSGTLDPGTTFEHTFGTAGVYNYLCVPHEGLGMVGLVVVGEPKGGPGTTPPDDVSTGAASQALTRLLELAGIGGGGGTTAYAYADATWDSYWYSLYNMSTNIAMSGNGLTFPRTDAQRETFKKRLQGMLKAADTDKPPVRNPNLNQLPFTSGDPHFTQKPVFDAGDGRPDAATLTWDPAESSKEVSPSSVAWTHTKGVTWAKNFEKHFDVLPASLAAKFRAQVLTTLAQLGVKGALVDGGPQGNGLLTKGDSLELVSRVAPGGGGVVDDAARPNHHSAMLWFLADLTSLARGGWYGYVNPEPLIPAAKIQQLTDGMARTTMNLFAPADVVSAGSARDLGQLLGAVGWYGTHAGSDDLRSKAASYADDLAAAVESRLEASGRVAGGADNQAATQGIVGQGLLWASQVEGVDHAATADAVLGYLLEDLWDDDAGTFASGADATTYRITSRDASDVTGGVNAAGALLDRDVESKYARFFDATFNRGRLQRAQRPQSVDEKAADAPPLPPKAGGEFGQAAVYNDAVAYDADADEWRVVDDGFTTGWALQLANQDIWIGQWAGDEYQGRGVPGRSDEPPA
ncbi:MAG: plastocyanin/azurin family copper-binding protein [Haloferacaceae archaeon]